MSIKVSYPLVQPGGFHRDNDKPAPVMYYDTLQNESARVRPYLGAGAVLFKFSKFNFPAKITIDLRRDMFDTLADADFVAPANSRDRYVLFEDFPARYLMHAVYCLAFIWLLPQNPNATGLVSTVEVEYFYRAK
jgi:hypothetical protein